MYVLHEQPGSMISAVRPTSSRKVVDLKVDLVPFSGDKLHWKTRSRGHCAQTRSLGCDDKFDAPGEEAILVGLVGLAVSGVEPEKVHGANVAWRSLNSTCKGMAFVIVKRAQSPSEAWKRLYSCHQAEGLSEQRQLQHELEAMSMMPGQNPKQFTRRLAGTSASKTD